MARFEREAQVLASLNHPNIAAIYGVEERHSSWSWSRVKRCTVPCSSRLR
jgi:serine/threonine protein kinase